MSAIFDEQKVVDVEKKLLNAMKKSAVEIPDQLLQDDLLFVLPTGDVITKQMDLENHRSKNLMLQEIPSS